MASAAVAPPDQSAEAAHGINPWLIAASVMLATFMEVLDTAIASVALPYIPGSLSASTDEATWVLTSYLVANAIVLPASNWFSLRFGRKRFLMSCVAIFTAASFACGAAPTRQARSRNGRLRLRSRRRSCPWPHPGGLAHRHVLLALRLLYQHPDRHPCPL